MHSHTWASCIDLKIYVILVSYRWPRHNSHRFIVNQNQINAIAMQCCHISIRLDRKEDIKCECSTSIRPHSHTMLLHIMRNTNDNAHMHFIIPIHWIVIRWGHSRTFWYCYRIFWISNDVTIMWISEMAYVMWEENSRAFSNMYKRAH